MNREKLLAAAIIGLQLVLIAEHSLNVTFSVISAVFALVFVRVQIPIHWSVHPIIGTAAGAAFFAEAIFYPPSIQNDWLLQGRFVISTAKTLVVLQLLELLSVRQKKHLSVRFDALAMASFLICFCRSLTDTNSFFFMIIAVAMAFLFALYWQSKNSHLPATRTTVLANSIWHLLFGLSLLIGTVYLANGTKSVANLFRYFLIDEVVQSRQNSTVAKVAYSSSGRLNEVTSFQQINPESIALNVRCVVAPGYLRGRAFTEFGRHGWTHRRNQIFNVRKSTTAENRLLEMENNEKETMFTVEPRAQTPFRSISVTNDSNHLGAVTFTPLSISHLFGSSVQILMDQNLIVRDGMDLAERYVSYVPRNNMVDELPNEARRALVRVPGFLHPDVKSLANTLSGTTDSATITNIQEFFQENYTYSIEPSRSKKNMDRISDLILNRTPSHCEYFATAASFMLRLNRIPTRYVTGFVVYERSRMDDDGVWFARNKNAHAWVEAYDRQSETWRTVEATPGMRYSKGVWDDNNDQNSAASLADVQLELESSASSGILSYLAAQTRIILQKLEYLQIYFNLFISMLLVLAFWWIRKQPTSKFEQRKYQLRHRSEEMRKIERKLKRLKLVREPSETLHQFSKRLRCIDSDHKEWIHEAANKILNYANERYRNDITT